MNYITEINEFNDWLEINECPKAAIALWYALMHVANKKRWPGSFKVAMSTLETKTGFKRSELFEARNFLQQKGRAKWRAQGGNLAAEYQVIAFACVHNTDAKGYSTSHSVRIADTSADTSADAKGYAARTQKGTINKQKLKTETSFDTVVSVEHPQSGGNAKEHAEKPVSEKKMGPPPDLPAVQEYFRERKWPDWPEDRINQQAEKYHNFYTANGWKVGRNPMKDWKAAVRSWLGNDFDSKNYSNGTNGAARSQSGSVDGKAGNQTSPVRSRGASIDQLQALKRSRSPDDAQRTDDASAEVVE